MKKVFLYLPILFFSFFQTASAQEKGQQKTFNYEEQMPTPTVDVGEYLKDKVHYPPEARAKGIQGRVLLSMMIDSSGDIGDIKVVVSASPLLDSEAVRVARTLPKFQPGTNANRRIATNYTLPIEFKLPTPPPREPKPSVDINAYLAKNLVYPGDARKNKIQGTVEVKFVIDTVGNILYPEVTKYLYPSCDAEAIRLVKNMPRFTPAEVKGKPVNVYFELPVIFALKPKS